MPYLLLSIISSLKTAVSAVSSFVSRLCQTLTLLPLSDHRWAISEQTIFKTFPYGAS